VTATRLPVRTAARVGVEATRADCQSLGRNDDQRDESFHGRCPLASSIREQSSLDCAAELPQDLLQQAVVIDRRVGSPRNNGPELLEAVAA
jgi:hypothetical protein